MEYTEWEPVYDAILADFGFGREADEQGRDWLADRVEPFDLDRIDFTGTVAIAGAAPSLESELDRVEAADAVVAASDAGVRLDANEIGVDLIVTDLDGDPEGTVDLASDGTPVAIHAHGDNQPALRQYLSEFPSESVLGTTQAAPRGPVRNFGGFTDGDRAAFLADHQGADSLVFPGWDLADPDVDELKRRKLEWAVRLLEWLERRRDEQFAVLDGVRDGIEPDDRLP